MSSTTYLQPCVSHRGGVPSSKGALLGRSMGEAAKESCGFAHQPGLVQAQSQESLKLWCSPQCRAQEKCLLPQRCPAARSETYRPQTWRLINTCERSISPSIISYITEKKYCFLFLPNYIVGFQLLWVFCLIILPACPFCACWFPSMWP